MKKLIIGLLKTSDLFIEDNFKKILIVLWAIEITPFIIAMSYKASIFEHKFYVVTFLIYCIILLLYSFVHFLAYKSIQLASIQKSILFLTQIPWTAFFTFNNNDPIYIFSNKISFEKILIT